MLKKTIIFLSLLTLFALMLFLPQSFFEAAVNGLSLCARRVIPSLFFFSVISLFALNTNAFSFIIRPLSPIMRLFGLSNTAFEPLFWGAFGGFPVGARLTAELYSQGRITKSEGENLLSFCNNCSPLFLISTAGSYGKEIYFIQLICALITGYFICSIFPAELSDNTGRYTKKEPFSVSLVNAVKGGAAGMISICAFIIFMSCITALFKLMGIDHPLITGFFEITAGISSVPYMSPFYLGCICFTAGFGSVSVALQTAAFAYEAGLSLKKYIYGKTINGALCFFFGYMYFTKRVFIAVFAVIIALVLRKIGKTLLRGSHADRQFNPKHRFNKRKNEKQLHL